MTDLLRGRCGVRRPRRTPPCQCRERNARETDRACRAGALRRSKPENVKEAVADLACLDDDGCAQKRREILRALEPPDVAILLFEAETRSEEHTSEIQSLMRKSYA